MSIFMRHISKHYGLSRLNYAQLYEWSITNSDLFWKEAWHFFDIQFFQNYHAITKRTSGKIQWFPGVHLNFAANLLRRRDHHPALLSYDEQGLRATITYKQLYEKVSRLSHTLREWGLQSHDRVASILPNMAETVIASLASASIGAIWSSCSPEFGATGIIERFQQIKPKILFAPDEYQYG